MPLPFSSALRMRLPQASLSALQPHGISGGGLLNIQTNAATIAAHLRSAATKVANILPAHKRAALMMHRFQIQHFETAVDSTGAPWPSRKRMTVRGKVHKLLVLSGIMRGSLTPRSTATGPEVFTRIPYAVCHQYGTVSIPQREFLYLNRREFDAVAKVYSDHLLEALGGAS